MSAPLKFYVNQSANDAGDALVESFSSPTAAAQITLTEGDRAREVEIHALVENPAGRQSGGQPFLYDDPAAWDGVRLGAGTIDAPVSNGTFTLTHTGTAETTAAIAYNATGADVQEAIRAGWPTDYSSAVVTGSAGGPWIVRSGVLGILNGEITADTSAISPVGSVVEVAHTQDGTNDVEDIHELSLVAAPAILRTSGWTALPAAAVDVETITEGSGTTSEEQRVTWNADAYGGSVRLSLALPHAVTISSSSAANPSILTTAAAHGLQTGDSVTISGHAGSTPSINSTYTVTRISETTFSIVENVTVAGTGGTLSATLTRTVGPLRYDVDEETFEEALAEHPASSATEDSFSVVRNGAGDYTVAFIGALANLAIAEMTATQTLKVPVGLSGTLDCLTSGVRRLLNGSRVPIVTNFEIKKIVGGVPTTIASRSDLRIRPELISSTPGSSDPAQIYLTEHDTAEAPETGQAPLVRSDTGRVDYTIIPRHLPNRLRTTTAKIAGILSTSPVGRITVTCWGDSVATQLWDQIQFGMQTAYGHSGLGMSALVIALGSGATSVTGAFDHWVNGNYYSVPTSGTIAWSGITTNQDTLDVYYLKEVGAGTFKIQSSPDGSSWTDELTVDASHTSTVGAFATVAKAAGVWQMRVVGVSGTCKVIGGSILSTANGVAFIPIAYQGIALASMNSTPSAILNPILARIAPDVLSFEMKDTAAAFQAEIPIAQARWEAALPGGCDYIYCASAPVNPDTQDNDEQVAQNAVLERLASANDLVFFDGYSAFGSYTAIAINSWSADGVHLNAAGAYYGARVLSRFLGLFDQITYSTAGYIARTTIEGSPIGTTTAAAGRFTTLDATSTMSLVGTSGGNGIVFKNASLAVIGQIYQTTGVSMYLDYDTALSIRHGYGGSVVGSFDASGFATPGLKLTALPTADPAVAGRVWNDSGILKISAG